MNTLLTIDNITNESLRLFLNSNSFIQHVDKQYDSTFGVAGAMQGDTLRIRKPLDYIVGTSSTITPQPTTEQNTVLTMASIRNVGLQFTDTEKVLEIDFYSDRYIKPAVNNLVAIIAMELMTVIDGVPNFVSNTNTGGFVISPTVDTWLSAQAKLSQYSLDTDDRKAIIDPKTEARFVASTAGLFNPQPVLGAQYTTGVLGAKTLGLDWYMDQTVQLHTTGAYSGNLFVSAAAGQTGSTIATQAISGGLNAGDIIVFSGVHMVNRLTKQSTGDLGQFVVTSPVANGGTSVSIYPPLTPPNNGNAVIYQTVDSSPASNAQIFVTTQPSEIYRQNFVFGPQAITFCTADLAKPAGGVIATASKRYDGVSLRMIEYFLPLSATWGTRLDCLFGFALTKPEWVAIVADMV